MKILDKRTIVFSVLLIYILVVTSCQSEENKKPVVLAPKVNELFCFQSIEAERKFDLNIYTNNESLEGIFTFSIGKNLLEKGLFEGHLSGDTIWGTMHFPEISDTLIDREVVFLMSDAGLQEGNGTLIQNNGILSFSDKGNIRFEDGGLLLTPVDCEPTQK